MAAGMTPYQHIDGDGDALTVYADTGYASVYAHTAGQPSVCVEVTKEDAPAFALAILEAAGYSIESAHSMGSAVRELKDHLHAQSVLAEREQLDKEAEALFEAFRVVDLCNLNHWGGLADVYKKPWIAAAKKARELHGGAK